MLPDFVILGAQKAASSALMGYLGARPDVYLPPRESRYFRDPWFLFQDVSVLAEEMAPAGPGVVRRGIKTPALLGTPGAAERVHSVLGEVDLIAILREPVERAISAYHHYMRLGFIPIVPAERGLTALLDGDYARSHPRAQDILTYGLYGASLQRYLDVFPRERLCVITDDQLRRDRQHSLGTVLDFLGLEAGAAAEVAERRLNVGVYSQARLRFLSVRNPVVLGSYPGYDGRYVVGARSRAGRVFVRAVEGFDQVVLTRVLGNAKPEVGAGVRARLAEYYRDDLRIAEALLDRDLSGWRA